MTILLFNLQVLAKPLLRLDFNLSCAVRYFMGPGVSNLAPSGSGIRIRNSRCRQLIPPSLINPRTPADISA